MQSPDYPPSSGTERELLENQIEFARAMVVYKATDITKEDGIKRLGPTATSVLGVVRHLTEVEHWWFQDRFAGIPYTESRSSEEDPDGEFTILERDTVESLIEGYKAACENSRQIAKGRSLDDLTAHARTTDNMHPNLRWVYLRLIDETARHGGNMEIYRELLDNFHSGRTTSS